MGQDAIERDHKVTPPAPAPKAIGPGKPTYDQSKKIRDVGGATESKPNPVAPFVNPDPKSIHKFDC